MDDTVTTVALDSCAFQEREAIEPEISQKQTGSRRLPLSVFPRRKSSEKSLTLTDCQALVKRRLLHKRRCGGRGTPRGEVIQLSPDDRCFRVHSLSVAAGGGGVKLKLAAKARGDCLSAARALGPFFFICDCARVQPPSPLAERKSS